MLTPYIAQTALPADWLLFVLGGTAGIVVLTTALGSRRYLRRLFSVTPSDLGAFTKGTLRTARKIVVFTTGATVVLVGIAMMVTPGPAVVVIPLGLAILATEFVWARRLLKWARAEISRRAQSLRGKPSGNAPDED